MSGRWCVAPTVFLLVAVGTTACGGASDQTVSFCNGYGTAMHELVVAARQYPDAPAQFATVYKATMADLDRLRAGAPSDRLREAFDTASFTFTVFSQDSARADFLTRADFKDNALVLACAEYGIELTPAAG
ncbi:hypothetical protein [Actinophytocola sp.]|uniref:hypothetical protein n=1 Tax=Actinophytocola sp. TaxID=1872138 RepID=UPI002ED91843